jgi:hypothetical protein
VWLAASPWHELRIATNFAQGEGLNRVRHVLLISIDGLHALDVAHFIDSHPNSALAELSRHGVTYSNAHTPATSDSFPGLLALVAGGSPVTHGLFYDVSYDRTIFAPTNTTCKAAPGSTMTFDESVDKYAGNISLDIIDPSFEVIRASGGHTAWADKHPVYDLVNGPSGKGVEDLYTPEITNVGGFDATASVVCTVESGLSFADTNVGLILSNPALQSRVVKTPVTTSQVAPTILKALAIDPNELKSVRKEGTPVLPFIFRHGE